MTKKEPGVKEIYEALSDFSGYVKEQFGFVEKKFELVTGQLTVINKEIHELKVGQKEMSKDIHMLKDDVVALGKSLYKHDTILENHRKRIHALEQN